MLDSDLENYQAQLSRFQLQVNSVTEDIVNMESNLNNTILTMKTTLVSKKIHLKLFGFPFIFCICSLSPLFVVSGFQLKQKAKELTSEFSVRAVYVDY